MRIRLLSAMLVVVLVTVFSMGAFALISTTREVTRFVNRGGMMGLNELVSELEDYYQIYGTWDGAGVILADPPGPGGKNRMGQGTGQQMMGDPSSSRLILTDTDGNILADTDPEAGRTRLNRIELNRAIALRIRSEKLVGYLYTDALYTIQPALVKPLIEKLNTAGVRAGLIGGGIALLLSLLLGYWFMKPVTRLSEAASALGKGDLSQRVPVHGNDELAQLGRTFNGMAESLQKAEQSRKNMTADIAHELRTPLSVQRASVEAMLDGVYPTNTETIAPLLEQNLLLTRLVDDLRLLALADAGELPLEIVDTDLGGICERVVHRFHSQAEQRQVQIQLSRTDNLPIVQADPFRVEQILTNLIGNAMRFSPPDTAISVVVDATNQTVTTLIRDEGPGIPEDSLPYIFDRFYKVDKGRSREEGGSGLGLAIARQLARAQGGDITAENHPDGGAVFKLTLPTRQG